MVGQRLATALQSVAEEGYHPGLPPTGNWWFWEIGIPNHLTDVLVLTYDVVPAALRIMLMDAITHFTPNPGFRGRGTSLAETGANRVDKSLRCALRGVLRESPEDLALARDALSDVANNGAASVFGYVTEGDGFYRDGSFVQHSKLPYAGTYGTVALKGIAQTLALLVSSNWEVTDPAQIGIVDAVENTFAPFIWHGVMMDTVRGRAVSRKTDTGATNALRAAHSVLLLAEVVPAQAREQLIRRALGWLEASPLDVTEVGDVAEIQRWIRAGGGTKTGLGDEPGLRIFADQERFTHRRNDWAFTISTSSCRIGRFEWGNRENATGWYQGDGATYLQLASDPQQTDLNYWPTVDPYRLPGTTVEMSQRKSGFEDGTGIPPTTAVWAGGTSVGGTQGVWGMDHVNHDASLRGRLSWFLLDDSIIALGAGITSTSDAAVETTVENRALRDDALSVTVDEADLVTPQWAHLEGVGGYAFMGNAAVSVIDHVRHGAWSDINHGKGVGVDEVHAMRYATVSILHGRTPADASYAYAILPGRTLAGTKRAARDLAAGHGPVVVANTPQAQVLRVPLDSGTLVFGNFFEAAETTDIVTDGPASVAVAETPHGVDLSVSDPSRTAESVTVTLPRIHTSSIESADDTVEVTFLSPLTLRVPVSGTRGHSHTASLR